VGVRPFWHEGQPFREVSYLQTYLRLEYPSDSVRELEFELTPDMTRRLAEKLYVTPEELLPASNVTSGTMASVPRKFVSSETHLPNQATADKLRKQTG
jgi:hypothetical protein